MRHDKTDEIAQLIDVPIPLNRESVCHVDPAAIDRRNMLLPGEIPGNREVSRGHSNFRKRAVKELRRSHKRDEGLNKHRSGIWLTVQTGVKRGYSGREQHQRKLPHNRKQDGTIEHDSKQREPESGLRTGSSQQRIKWVGPGRVSDFDGFWWILIFVMWFYLIYNSFSISNIEYYYILLQI